MRLNKKLINIFALISAVSLVAASLLHYKGNNTTCGIDIEYWVNILIGIFSSAALTLMTSILSYLNEKRNTLESFLYHTQQLLSFLNKYQERMSLEQKIIFFLDYYDLDKSSWDMDFGNIAFLFDPKTQKRRYIYDSIYKPILDFNQCLANHVLHFRQHISGICKNDRVMSDFVAELESHLRSNYTKKLPSKFDENGNAISFEQYNCSESKLVHNVSKELWGKYYNIMYGKRIAKKHPITQEEDASNG